MGADGSTDSGDGGGDLSTAQDTAAPDTAQSGDAARDTTTDGPHNCNEPGFSCPGDQVCKPLQLGGWKCFPPGIEP